MQDDQSFTLLDGERLRIHFTDITDLKALTSTSPSIIANAQAWTGTWSRSGQALNIMLNVRVRVVVSHQALSCATGTAAQFCGRYSR